MKKKETKKINQRIQDFTNKNFRRENRQKWVGSNNSKNSKKVFPGAE